MHPLPVVELHKMKVSDAIMPAMGAAAVLGARTKPDVHSRDGVGILICTTNATSGILTATYQSKAVAIWGEVCRPQGLKCNRATAMTSDIPDGCAGYANMRMEQFCLLPEEAAFPGFQIYEVPSEGSHHGHFSDAIFQDCWNHSIENGAGVWQVLDKDNFCDIVGIDDCGKLASGGWIDGAIVWPIPVKWDYPTDNALSHEQNLQRDGEYLSSCEQVFTINAEGTVCVSKLGHSVFRMTNSTVIVDGVVNTHDYSDENIYSQRTMGNKETMSIKSALAGALCTFASLPIYSSSEAADTFEMLMERNGCSIVLEDNTYSDQTKFMQATFAVQIRLPEAILAVEKARRIKLAEMYASLCYSVYSNAIATLPKRYIDHIGTNDTDIIVRHIRMSQGMDEALANILNADGRSAEAWEVRISSAQRWNSIEQLCRPMYARFQKEHSSKKKHGFFKYTGYEAIMRHASKPVDRLRQCSMDTYSPAWRHYWRLPKPERGKFMERVCNAIGDVPQWYQEILANGEPSPEPDPETPADELERWSYETQKALQTFDIE